MLQSVVVDLAKLFDPKNATLEAQIARQEAQRLRQVVVEQGKQFWHYA